MAKDKGKKKPQIAAAPPVGKHPVLPSKWPTDKQSNERLSWRLGDMEWDGPWNWRGIKATKWREIMDLLADLERLTWGEACSGGNPRVKIVKVADAPPAIRDRLEATQRDDADELVEIRMSGVQRMFGVRRGTVVHLLWWDPTHNAWPAKKKHT
jgi:hypothetical protein